MLLSVVRETFARIHFMHNCTGRILRAPANDIAPTARALWTVDSARHLGGEAALPGLPAPSFQRTQDAANSFSKAERLACPVFTFNHGREVVQP